LAIFGSICLYPRGGVAYIDAIFLSSGSATQSGLNTVNLNILNTWQQFILLAIAMAANPIAINSFVVFLRLYWFEKRFQHIAAEAKKNRRSIAKTISKSKAGERDIGQEERGVQGRNIVVMHETTRPNGMTYDGNVPPDLDEHLKNAISKDDGDEAGTAVNGQASDSTEETDRPKLASHQTQIRFADQPKPGRPRTSDDDVPAPIQRNPEEHIAFLERQRNPSDDAVLRIPGPRDADAGVQPEMVDQSDAHQTLSRGQSMFSSRRDSDDRGSIGAEDHAYNDSRRRNITIEEPTRPRSLENMTGNIRAAGRTLGVLRFRKPRILSDEKVHHEDIHPTRSRRGTLSSIRRTFSQPREDGIPYLSWEPEIGRNSAFVDLTEAQRDELGGIEYRSLKSLALLLIMYYWGFTIFGFVGLIPWILNSNTYGPVVENIGQGRVWWGIFTSGSGFTDLGYTLTPDSMQSFQAAIWPLLLMSFLIIIGNTGFPIMLRFIIWVTSLYVPKKSGIWEELRFLLDHPRRCFTLLFPSKATWYLFGILVLLNGLDLIFFIILDVSFQLNSFFLSLTMF
jgi:potassium uptake Trk family protein